MRSWALSYPSPNRTLFPFEAFSDQQRADTYLKVAQTYLLAEDDVNADKVRALETPETRTNIYNGRLLSTFPFSLCILVC